MNKRAVNTLIIVVLGIASAAAGFIFYEKEKTRKELERVRAEYEARPELPIEIHYREALLGPGLVGMFKNTSDRHLAVVTTFYNPTLKKEENYRLDLAPGITKEVGHSEGWAFASGDTIKIVHNEYKTRTVELR